MYERLGTYGPLPYPFAEMPHPLEQAFLAEIFTMHGGVYLVEDLMQVCASLGAVLATAARDEETAEQDVAQALRVLVGYQEAALGIFRHWQAEAQILEAPEPAPPLAVRKKGATA